MIIDLFAGGGGASLAQQVHRIGNSVVPQVAAAVVLANWGKAIAAAA